MQEIPKANRSLGNRFTTHKLDESPIDLIGAFLLPKNQQTPHEHQTKPIPRRYY